MRIFVYGMQSSGASLFAYWLAQKPDRIGIIDLWHQYAAPDLSDTKADIVLKAVVTEKTLFEQHVANFKPHIKILFTRNKADNWSSLYTKEYRDHSGTIDNKFKILESYQKQPALFDYIVTYEDFLADHQGTIEKLKQIAEPYFYKFKRSKNDIIQYSVSQSPWCKENHMVKWNVGNIHWSSGMLEKQTPVIKML